MYFSSVFGFFYAFSVSEFTLVFSIPRLLVFRLITVFLPAIPPYKEVAAVTAAYHDPFRAVIGLPLTFRGGSSEIILDSVNYAMSNTEFTSAENSIRFVFGFTFSRILKSGMRSISFLSSSP